MTDQNKTLGQRIKSAREALGKTQVATALALGIPHSTLNRWEKDKQPVTKKRWEKISETLKIPIDEIRDLAKKWISINQRQKLTKANDCTTVNILPLMKTICGLFGDDANQEVTIEDMKFLTETQLSLPSPMSPALIVELLRNRHGITK